MGKRNVAMIGLGVMGSNLARNIASRGYEIAVYNRSREVTDEFMSKHGKSGFVPAYTLEELVSKLESPRQIFLMVKAGQAVNAVVESLLPLLAKGDIILDGGNSFFEDTQRLEKQCADRGVCFLGVGISGGEEGALRGPSIMPGGPREGWKHVAPMLEKIAAQAEGRACTTYIGPDGSGHFVKMVHNGIEYGDMQLIAEAYDLLRQVLRVEPPELAQIFESWNKGPLYSYLMEITSQIFLRKDDLGKGYLVDSILDSAEQKGTGRWTVQVALELGVAIPTIGAAVDARILSSLKKDRVAASRNFASGNGSETVQKDSFIKDLESALYATKILAYAQGMDLLRRASDHYKWSLPLDEIAAIWRGGCIIRARFLNEIQRAYKENPKLPNLILDPALKKDLLARIPALRSMVAIGAKRGIPCIGFTNSLAYFDSLRSSELPQNLTQAQRDYFGAHTYQRKDREGIFHTEWEP